MANPSKSLYHNYFGISAGVPSGVTAENGDLYYDSGTNVMMCYINGVWTPLGTGAGGVQDSYAELYYYNGRCGDLPVSWKDITFSTSLCQNNPQSIGAMTAGEVKGAPYITVNAATGVITIGASGAGRYLVNVNLHMYCSVANLRIWTSVRKNGVAPSSLFNLIGTRTNETVNSFESESLSGIINVAAGDTFDVVINAPSACVVRIFEACFNMVRIPPSGLSANGNSTMTPEGGFAIKLTNKTGANSVKGTMVKTSTGTDNAFQTTAVNDFEPVGVVYEAGIADGSPCWVVVGGIAEVLLQDALASTRGNWVRTSITQAGRADASNAVAPGLVLTHFAEIGHCLESKVAGTNIMCKIVMHFN